MRRVLKIISIMLLTLFLSVGTGYSTIYYVDSAASDRTCIQAESSSTPTNTVQDVIDNCSLTAGDTVKIKGTFSNGTTFDCSQSGSAIHSLETVDDVSGSIIDFSSVPAGVSTTTDYVILYNSRKGNSGAFKISDISSDEVTVDNARLPGSSFITETSGDPSTTLDAIIVRPISFEAWDAGNVPSFPESNKTWDTNGASYLRFYNMGTTWTGAYAGQFGSCYTTGGSQYVIWDTMESQGGRNAWFTDVNQSNAKRHMTQYCNFWDFGYDGGSSHEIIYNGNFSGAGGAGDGFDYNHFMYNYLAGDTGLTTSQQFNAIDDKDTASYTMYWGNEITAISTRGAGGAIVVLAGDNAVFGNNYIHDCDATPTAEIIGIYVSGINNNLIFNNIIDSIDNPLSLTYGIQVDSIAEELTNIDIYNNTIYNLTSNQAGIGSIGIRLVTDNNLTDCEIQNNIFHTIANSGAGTAYGVYETGAGTNPTSDYNDFFTVKTADYFGMAGEGNDITTDPGLVAPATGNFSLSSESANAVDAGVALSTEFTVDNHDAANPTITDISQSIERGGWDIGVYEYDSPPPGQGTTHYVDADAAGGGDGTLATPWDEVADINGESFVGGDIILFNRGDIWREQLTIPSSGTSGNPITIASYGTGAEPIISGADDVTTSGWADQGSNIWRHAIGATEPLVVIFNGSIVGTEDAATDAQYEWTYSNPNLDIYAEDDPDNAVYYTVIEAAQRDYCIYASAKTNITLDGLNASISNLRNINMTSVSDNWIINNCNVWGAYLYGIAFSDNSTGLLIDNCLIYENHLQTSGTGMGVWGSGNNVTVKNSIIRDNGLTGSDGRGVTFTGSDGGQALYNRVWGNTGAGIEGFTAINATIHGNIITSGDGLEVKQGSNNTIISCNICIDGATSFGDGGGTPSTNLQLYNNLFYGTRPTFDLSDLSTIILKNNIFDNDDWYQIYLDTATGLTTDNNLYGNRCTGYPDVAQIAAVDTYTLAEWRTVTSQDASSLTGNPLFKNPANNNFNLKNKSPAIDAGVDVGLIQDYRQASVPKGVTFDIGPIESGSTGFDDTIRWTKDVWNKGKNKFNQFMKGDWF